MVWKRLFILFLLFAFSFSWECAWASPVITGVDGSVRPVRIKKENKKKKEYKYKTVLKHYKPYMLTVTNTNGSPVLLNADSEVVFILNDGYELNSQSRRTIYRKSRKRDMGRYYWLAIPGSIIAAGVTGITLFIGAPIGAAIAVGMYAPTDKAVRNNVAISQDLYTLHDMPIRLEPNKKYEIRILAPKDAVVKNVKITNVSFDMKKMYDMSFPVTTEEQL